MNLLVTGAFNCTEEELNRIRQMGHNVFFMQYEKDKLPCCFDEVEGVICNGLFLYHDIRKFTSLKYIQLTSAGFDRVDMEYVKEKGIKILGAKGVYSIPMAEFALCGVLSLYKKINFFAENKKVHKWEKNRNILELFDKKVCIIGCGSVGRECAKRFSAMGCRTVGVDLLDSADNDFEIIFSFDKKEEAIYDSDIVIITAPLTEQTRDMFDENLFGKLKDNAILVSISRGQLVDTNALINALLNKLGGAVLDVFDTEPLDESSPLWDMENVILTPHNSFVGEGNSKRLVNVIMSNLKEFFS